MEDNVLEYAHAKRRAMSVQGLCQGRRGANRSPIAGHRQVPQPKLGDHKHFYFSARHRMGADVEETLVQLLYKVTNRVPDGSCHMG